MEKTPDIDAKSAAEIAALYLREMLPDATNLRLEEVEKSSHNKKTIWLITISFQFDSKVYGGIAGFQHAMGKREYKVLTVDAESQDVLSMKILAL